MGSKKQDKKKQIHKYRELVIARSEGTRRTGERVKGTKRYQVRVVKSVSHGDEKHSRVNVVSNPVVTLCGDRRGLHTYTGEHSITYTVAKSLCCTPETHTVCQLHFSFK